MLTKITPVTAPALAVPQSDVLDTTAGRALIVGAFGLGRGAHDISDFTTDEANVGRFFRALETAAGGPGAHVGGIALPISGTPSICYLAVDEYGTVSTAIKYGANDTPSWVKQIERGNNSNGEYTKFADGTILQWVEFFGAVTSSTRWDQTLPSSMLVGNDPVITGGEVQGSSFTRRHDFSFNVTDTEAQLYSDASTALAYPVRAIIVGRWF